MSIWRPRKMFGHAIVNAIFYLIVLTILMYVEKHIPHVVHFSSWHSNSQLKRYSEKCELFWSLGKKLFKIFKKKILKD
jgi:hypothetical protein